MIITKVGEEIVWKMGGIWKRGFYALMLGIDAPLGTVQNTTNFIISWVGSRSHFTI